MEASMGFVILIFDHHAITLKVKKCAKEIPNLSLKFHDYYFLNTKMKFENTIII
jgi:hypothetical protein